MWLGNVQIGLVCSVQNSTSNEEKMGNTQNRRSLKRLALGISLKVKVDMDPVSCSSRSLLGPGTGLRGTPDVLFGHQEIYSQLLISSVWVSRVLLGRSTTPDHCMTAICFQSWAVPSCGILSHTLAVLINGMKFRDSGLPG